MKTLGLPLSIKNTFVHYRQQQENTSRSTSAPPAYERHRLADHIKKVDDSPSLPSVSTICESLALDHTTVDSGISDNDDAISYCDTDFTAYEELSLPASRDELKGNDYWLQSSTPDLDHAEQASAQLQLEQMSDMVMDIWAKLRAIESSTSTEAPTEDAEDNVQASCQPCLPAAFSEQCRPVEFSAPLPTTGEGQAITRQRLSSKACVYVPELIVPEYGPGVCIQSKDVFASVKEALMFVPGVTSVTVNSGPKGTLTTLNVQLESDVWKASVIEACKTTLLDVAARSESTYVLGYQAQPFEDDKSGFFATLAEAKDQAKICWDTYTLGCCRWGRKCKSQHPGRFDLKPLKVVVG